jgi:hypothetical protein
LDSTISFNQLSWAAVCFYYRSAGDNKYSRIMSDTNFLLTLRRAPFNISPAEFEEKVLLGYVNIDNYDLLIGHRLAESVLGKITEMREEIALLQDMTLLDCNLSDSSVTEKISRIYAGLYSVHGLWLTGVSKVAHLLNDRLFVMLNLDISNHFGLLEGDTSLTQWLRVAQQNAQSVTRDFQNQGLTGTPEKYISDSIGYTEYGYEKSMVKFLDEYFWLRFGDNLPIPPKWVPPVPQQIKQS